MAKAIVKYAARIGVSLFLIGALFVAVPPTTSAASVISNACNGSNKGFCNNQSASVYTVIKNLINILITIGGIVAVVMIVVGGITYTTSAGDSTQIKRAKDTIVYAIVGLVVAIMAFAIVNWILGRL